MRFINKVLICAAVSSAYVLRGTDNIVSSSVVSDFNTYPYTSTEVVSDYIGLNNGYYGTDVITDRIGLNNGYYGSEVITDRIGLNGGYEVITDRVGLNNGYFGTEVITDRVGLATSVAPSSYVVEGTTQVPVSVTVPNRTVVEKVPVPMPYPVEHTVVEQVPVEHTRIEQVPVEHTVVKEVAVPVEVEHRVVQQVPVEHTVLKEVAVPVEHTRIEQVPVEHTILKEVAVPVEVEHRIIEQVPVEHTVVKEVAVPVEHTVVKEVPVAVPVEVEHRVVERFPTVGRGYETDYTRVSSTCNKKHGGCSETIVSRDTYPIAGTTTIVENKNYVGRNGFNHVNAGFGNVASNVISTQTFPNNVTDSVGKFGHLNRNANSSYYTYVDGSLLPMTSTIDVSTSVLPTSETFFLGNSPKLSRKEWNQESLRMVDLPHSTTILHDHLTPATKTHHCTGKGGSSSCVSSKKPINSSVSTTTVTTSNLNPMAILNTIGDLPGNLLKVHANQIEQKTKLFADTVSNVVASGVKTISKLDNLPKVITENIASASTTAFPLVY